MHPLLQRQIARYLKDADSVSAEFIAAIDAAYKSADTDRLQVERSLELMSQELTERNETLRDELSGRQRVQQELLAEKTEQAALIKKLEEAHNQLLQSEKMASIGQLAAGVAHEINNPIGYVASNMTTLRKYVADLLGVIALYENIETQARDAAFIDVGAFKQRIDLNFLRDDVVNLMNESLDGLARVKKIVQDLKDFSHVDSAEWQWVDVHNGIDSTLNIVHNEIKYKAEVVKDYGKLPDIECIGSQLNQVFMNMLINAAHAIETRGTITVRTGTRDEKVWVEIADTGKGIAPENLKRIFDPFFTTKPVGKGTGLGLSLSYGIVQKHHGRIEVDSVVDCGTRFTVWLPVRQPDARAAA